MSGVIDKINLTRSDDDDDDNMNKLAGRPGEL